MSFHQQVVCDADQRALAIDPSRSCIVQAPAGSGKTELLIQRFLGLLAAAEQPREILAITFTRKAAAEMRRRVLASLDAASKTRPEELFSATTWELGRRVLERDRIRGWQLLDNPTQLQILTIDSFNAGLARQLPWSSGLGGVPRIEEDPAPLYRQAVRQVLFRLSDSNKEATGCLLRHLDNRYDRLAQLLEALLASRDQWLPLLLRHDPQERRRQLEQTLEGYVVSELTRLLNLIPADVRDAVPVLAEHAHATLGPDGWPGLAELAQLNRCPQASADEHRAWQGLAGLLLTEQGSWRRRPDKRCGFPAGNGSAAERKELLLNTITSLGAIAEAERQLAVVRALPPVRYADEQWQVLEAMIELLPLAAAELWLVFNEAGGVDFIEVALRALSALGQADDPSDLLLRIDARLRHILVDEFQDTSRLQWRLLERLTSGWSVGDTRTLYLVGDPMQSIYRFREAEVGLFLRARAAGLGEISLQALQLHSNFRSRPELVSWVNSAFPGIFPALEDEGLGAVPFANAAATRPAAATAVEVHPLFGRNDQAEAELVAELVQQALESQSGTVAVLVRARSHLSVILAALRRAGIRYQGRDLDPLAGRPAARDLIALTRALLHPGDRLHWLAVLRAPWCGLSLEDLHILAENDPERQDTIPERLVENLRLSRLSADGQLRVRHMQEIFLRAVSVRGRVTLRRLVEGCWLALGGPCCVDPSGLNDVYRIFALLEELDAGGDILSWQQLQDRLDRLFAAPDPLADGRLQVMTIHKAKGLEFDTVILPGLGRKPRRSEAKLLRWLDHPAHGLLLAPLAPADGSSRDPVYDSIGRLEQQKDDYETMRLLYVAVTRARERLHLFGHVRIGRDGTASPEVGSFLSLLWPVCQRHFSGQWDDPAPESCVEVTPQVELKRLPTAWQLPDLAMTALPKAAQINRPSRQQTLELKPKALSDPDSEIGLIIGIVLHAWLEKLVNRTGRIETLLCHAGEQISADLQRTGLPERLHVKAVEIVLQGLRTAATGERGQWVLAPYPEGACELPLSGVVDGALVHAIVDRTFIENDTRWVIDYKTGSPRDNSAQMYLSKELERYRQQLALYVRLFEQLDPGRKVRAGLYYPLFDGWIEWGEK